jgi:uncharacterized protein YjbJ (UPF0337 family)
MNRNCRGYTPTGPIRQAHHWQCCVPPDQTSWNKNAAVSLNHTKGTTSLDRANLKPKQETIMNWDQIEGRWKQLTGDIKKQWGRLTDDDVDAIDGQQDKLVGRIQEAYGIEREEADRQVREWFNRL